MGLTIWSFLIVMLLMTASGAASIIKKRKTTEDYLVASRDVKPWLAALSTVATNNSGFMFIGMIGYSYRLGIESIWMMVGWIVGDIVAWTFVHPTFRTVTDKHDMNTLSVFLGADEKGISRPIVVVSGLLTFVFLCVYAAAQFGAGSTALHALFGWEMWIGVAIGAVIVLLYSYAGGIRADIWTDAAQSFVMLISMVGILAVGSLEVGGWSGLMENLESQDPGLVGLFPEERTFGPVLFVLGFVFGGFGASGQPHIMTRIMSIETREAVRRARIYYFAWFIPFFIASVGVGLISRAVLPDLASQPIAQGLDEPTELALPLVTMELLHPIFVGFALAGLFAATVSTADSQIIVCSGAITNDLRPRWKHSYIASKLGTFAVTAMGLGIALFAPEGVFVLVLIAWSALAASLGSVLIVRCARWRLGSATGVAMMLAALVTVVAWRATGFEDDVLEALPGMVAAFTVYGVGRAAGAWRSRRAGGS